MHRAAALGGIAAQSSCCASRRVIGVLSSQDNHYMLRDTELPISLRATVSIAALQDSVCGCPSFHYMYVLLPSVFFKFLHLFGN